MEQIPEYEGLVQRVVSESGESLSPTSRTGKTLPRKRRDAHSGTGGIRDWGTSGTPAQLHGREGVFTLNSTSSA